jgi:biopolymer transport protein ExbB
MEFLKEYIDYIIFATLGVMAFVACWCVIERILFLRKVHIDNYTNQTDLDNALSYNLTTLYIIYSNAPYVGLLGTVIGIMISFYDMSISATIDVKSVVLGLSLALKATALGLLVAIPSLIAYNYLLRWVNLISSQYTNKAQN